MFFFICQLCVEFRLLVIVVQFIEIRTKHLYLDGIMDLVFISFINTTPFAASQAKLFFDRAEEVCSLLKNKKDRSCWLLLMKRMGFILAAINSNLKILPRPFQVYTRVTADLIVRNLKWLRIIPTLHTVSDLKLYDC